MSRRKLRAIIFDIGGVLIRVDINRAMAGLAEGLSLSPSEIWGLIQKDAHWPDWQEGRMAPHDWHLHLIKRLGISLTFEQFTQVWNRALDPKPLQDAPLFENLSRNYRLALLSNSDPIHVTYLETSYDFFRFFPLRIYSCKVGARKPNPLIYRAALRACKADANEALYIDDVPGYVEAARHLGLAGLRYETREQLARELAGQGVLAD